MEYAKVSNGEVLKVCSLPPNLAGKSKEELLKLGWYEVHNEEVEAKEWQYLNCDGIEIKKDYVLRKFSVENISLDEFKNKKIQLLKHNAYVSITSKYPYYKQINASLGIYDDEKIAEIKEAIQKVRKEVDEKEQKILNAKTYEDVADVYIEIIALIPDKFIDEKGHIKKSYAYE